jgi:hypothetical protein
MYINEITLNIEYQNYKFEIVLNELNIKNHNISAMTLFKDDYLLLSQYFKYYSKMGIDVFFLYYNDHINYQLLEYIFNINNNQYTIYLIPWDYIYWWNYSSSLKHHHAQTMAINDSLHILKNYSNYVLYNDLDEYIILETNNLNELISQNNNIDVYVFKNRFCKMSDQLIYYKDFDTIFDMNKIIKGNYWDKKREKNLIKLENINIMGVHYPFPVNNEYKYKITSEFYHIINFEEKNREYLMNEYIVID